MKIKSAADYDQIKDSVVTIGTFDGVHIGHQKIIKRLVAIAQTEQLQALVLTFFPHPRMVVQKDTSIKLINTIDEKADLIQDLGVDHLVIKAFTKDFSRLTSLEYVRDVLVNKLHVKHIIVGMTIILVETAPPISKTSKNLALFTDLKSPKLVHKKSEMWQSAPPK